VNIGDLIALDNEEIELYLQNSKEKGTYLKPLSKHFIVSGQGIRYDQYELPIKKDSGLYWKVICASLVRSLHYLLFEPLFGSRKRLAFDVPTLRG
jgi:hypothetical protein